MRTVTLPSGPALFGLRSSAPVLPTAVYFTRRVDGHFAWIRNIIDGAAQATQHLGLAPLALEAPGMEFPREQLAPGLETREQAGQEAAAAGV